MKLSQTMSLAEAVTNVVVGYGAAVLAQLAVCPLFGIAVAFGDHLLIGAAFTALCGAPHKRWSRSPERSRSGGCSRRSACAAPEHDTAAP